MKTTLDMYKSKRWHTYTHTHTHTHTQTHTHTHTQTHSQPRWVTTPWNPSYQLVPSRCYIYLHYNPRRQIHSLLSPPHSALYQIRGTLNNHTEHSFFHFFFTDSWGTKMWLCIHTVCILVRKYMWESSLSPLLSLWGPFPLLHVRSAQRQTAIRSNGGWR